MKFSVSGKIGKLVFKVDGKVVEEEEYERLMEEEKAKLPQVDQGAPFEGISPWQRPMMNKALAVHPSQVEQANERNKRNHVNVSYAPDGHAIVTSRENYRNLLALEGMCNNDGGAGDDPKRG